MTTQTVDPKVLAEAVSGYLECAAWCSVMDQEGEEMDVSGLDFSDSAKAQAAAVVRDFLTDALPLVERERDEITSRLGYFLMPSSLGHDFWLTRNGHGAGFWDRGLGQLGTRLTELCKPYGESYVYIGNDDSLELE